MSDSRNADPARVTGICVHGIAHQQVAERTGSTKHLGDGNQSMKVSLWLNEGLAKLLRLQFLGECARVDRAASNFQAFIGLVTWRELSRRMNDLDDARREKAFVCAAGVVSRLVREASVAALFDRLIAIDPGSACAVEGLLPAFALLRA